MATSYLDRRQIIESKDFKDRLTVAIWILALTTLNDALATAGEKTWARGILRGGVDPEVLRRMAVKAMADATVGDAGLAATDAQIQTLVNASLAQLVAG